MSTLSLIAFATTNLIWLLFFVVNFREHKMLTTILLCVVISFNFACNNLRGMAPIFVQKQAVVLNKENNQIVINHYVKKNIFYRVNEFINNKNLLQET